MKLVMDRRKWTQWLYQARKRYGLVILNYTVTSNHVHLLVVDEKGRDVIPQSIKLVAGRTGQEYNVRKTRKGAFWEDRYHATVIESEHHLFRCLVYIDLNMVRAGVVSHPSEWPFGGYNEIQKPRRKCVLIAHQKLVELTGFKTYEAFRIAHAGLVSELLASGNNYREAGWSESVAVGSKAFVATIKEKLGLRAKGRKVVEKDGKYQLREEAGVYTANIEAKKGSIGDENGYIWNVCDVNTFR
nr:transposase [Desulfopila sp. IMCC35008]